MIKSKYSKEFLDWYSVYPRKIGKKSASKAYENAIKGISVEDLKNETIGYAEKVRWKDKSYIPHPATRLNGERREDEDL